MESRIDGCLLSEYLAPHLLEQTIDIIGSHQHEHMDLGFLAIDDEGKIHEKLEQIYIAELLDIVPLPKAARFLGLFVDTHQFGFKGIPDPIEVLDKGLNLFPEDGAPLLTFFLRSSYCGDVRISVHHPISPALRRWQS